MARKAGIFSRFKLGESYTSLFLGVGVVAIASFLIFSFGKNRQVKQTSSIQEGPINKEKKVDSYKKNKAQKIYIVKKGDSLWNISQEVYKSGYDWVEIAKANNLTKPGLIFSGDRLVIPEIKKQKDAEMSVRTKQIEETKTSAIKEDSYKVVKGDTLWDIAVRAYGDGYKWPEIAKVNKLINPDLIFSENVLKIPR